MKIRNVLILPAGTEIGLEIHQALAACKELRVFGAGQDVLNHARFIYSEYHVVPSIHEQGWLEALTSVCLKLEIDYVFPAYDDLLVALSQVADRIPATLIAPPADICELTRSKRATYLALAGQVRVPQLFDSPGSVVDFPVLVKPDRGQGSQGVQLVETREALDHAMRTIKGLIICEYLPGDEFTIDCFSDRERGLLFAGARSRRRTRNGISVNTVTGQLPEVRPLAQNLGRILKLRGAWFFQLKRAADGELALLEVAPRIAGGMAAHRVKGVNFPLLSIFEQERLEISLLVNEGEVELDRALSNRYRYELDFGTAYVDLDDTLILRDKVALPVIRFIYQCLNDGKQVKLITRHRDDIGATLRRFRLAGLFDDIIHLEDSAPKSGVIRERDSIFIDDSFAERLEVARNCGIPTFDVSMLEVLTERSDTSTGSAPRPIDRRKS